MYTLPQATILSNSAHWQQALSTLTSGDVEHWQVLYFFSNTRTFLLLYFLQHWHMCTSLQGIILLISLLWPWIEHGTFRSSVWRSPNWAIKAPYTKFWQWRIVVHRQSVQTQLSKKSVVIINFTLSAESASPADSLNRTRSKFGAGLDSMAEWLRRLTRNQLGWSRTGSSPVTVGYAFKSKK